MAGTTKLSVEKALNKIREAEKKSETTRMNEETAELDEAIKRMREQRLRLEAHQQRSTEGALDAPTSSSQPSTARPRGGQRELRNNHFSCRDPSLLTPLRWLKPMKSIQLGHLDTATMLVRGSRYLLAGADDRLYFCRGLIALRSLREKVAIKPTLSAQPGFAPAFCSAKPITIIVQII